jgi:large subunit ribosomal protein L25
MKHVNISVEKRSANGTDQCRGLRREGRLPAVVYGGKDQEGGPNRETVSLSLDQKAFETQIHAGVKFYNLEIDETTTPTIVKELQWDALEDTIVHVDFERIDLESPVTATTMLDFKGTSKGEKVGGHLIKRLAYAKISGPPRSLPEMVTVNVEALEANDRLRLSNVPLPEGMSWTSKNDDIVAEVKLKSESDIEEEEEKKEEEESTE